MEGDLVSDPSQIPSCPAFLGQSFEPRLQFGLKQSKHTPFGGFLGHSAKL